MKLAITLISLLLFSTAFASDLTFKCEMKDVHYVSQFSLEAKVVSLEKSTFENVEFDFTIKKAGFNTQTERLVVTRDGSIKHFPAGTYANKPSVGLVSAVKGAEVEMVSLYVDFAGPFHSQIRMLDGRAYFGTCHSL